jgi:hypothetical protein
MAIQSRGALPMHHNGGTVTWGWNGQSHEDPDYRSWGGAENDGTQGLPPSSLLLFSCLSRACLGKASVFVRTLRIQKQQSVPSAGGYWFQNVRHSYWYALHAGDYDLMLPLYRMYMEQLPVMRERSRQWYKHNGTRFAETVPI